MFINSKAQSEQGFHQTTGYPTKEVADSPALLIQKGPLSSVEKYKQEGDVAEIYHSPDKQKEPPENLEVTPTEQTKKEIEVGTSCTTTQSATTTPGKEEASTLPGWFE